MYPNDCTKHACKNESWSVVSTVYTHAATEYIYLCTESFGFVKWFV